MVMFAQDRCFFRSEIFRGLQGCRGTRFVSLYFSPYFFFVSYFSSIFFCPLSLYAEFILRVIWFFFVTGVSIETIGSCDTRKLVTILLGMLVWRRLFVKR